MSLARRPLGRKAAPAAGDRRRLQTSDWKPVWASQLPVEDVYSRLLSTGHPSSLSLWRPGPDSTRHKSLTQNHKQSRKCLRFKPHACLLPIYQISITSCDNLRQHMQITFLHHCWQQGTQSSGGVPECDSNMHCIIKTLPEGKWPNIQIKFF